MNLQEIEKRSLDAVIRTGEFEIFEEIDRGDTGKVLRARRIKAPKQDAAIKIFAPNQAGYMRMISRKLTPEKIMQKECLPLAACLNVVPRNYNEEGNFIWMPLYEKTLADVIGEGHHYPHRWYLGHGLTLDQILKYSKDMVNAIYEVHYKLGIKYHGDVKPDNFVIDDSGNLLILDFSTMYSHFGSTSPRSNVGYIYIRDPRVFNQPADAHSDIWSFGAILHRMIKGKYPLEDEINEIQKRHNIENIYHFFENMDTTIDDLFKQEFGKSVEDVLQKKVKKVPRKLRFFEKKLLLPDFHPHYGFFDTIELKKGLDEVIENCDLYKKFRGYFIKFGIPAAMLGMVGIISLVKEPTELTVPKLPVNQNYSAPLSNWTGPDEKYLRIKREDLELKPIPLKKDQDESQYKLCSDSKHAAYLLKAYAQAYDIMKPKVKFSTDEQFKIHAMHSDNSDIYIPWIRKRRSTCFVIRSIEYAIRESGSGNFIDLEDICTIARIGEDRLDYARRLANEDIIKEKRHANGYDFKEYRKFIVPQVEREFIETWLRIIEY